MYLHYYDRCPLSTQFWTSHSCKIWLKTVLQDKNKCAAAQEIVISFYNVGHGCFGYNLFLMVTASRFLNEMKLSEVHISRYFKNMFGSLIVEKKIQHFCKKRLNYYFEL